jgi:16S rRNA (adenine1518-N6/adenine1519-N6)-dimethyltransferase
MDLTSRKTIQSILQTQGTKPKKGLGQNFLISKGVLGDILKAAQLTKSDTVLEIGPGIGTLTRELAQSANKVVAVEKDSAMVEILRETTKDLSNITIISGDILSLAKLSFGKLSLAKEYKVVANLPYYITSPVIRNFLELKENSSPSLMVLMVQKEVSQRICAKPPDMSLLAVAVQFYATPSIVSYVKKSCFWPQPKVDSAILRIAPLINTDKKLINADTFFKVVKAGFKQPRKQLGNTLTSGLGFSRHRVEILLQQAGIQPTQRAETLSVENWVALTKSLP